MGRTTSKHRTLSYVYGQSDVQLNMDMIIDRLKHLEVLSDSRMITIQDTKVNT